MSNPINTLVIERLYEELIHLDEIAGELDPESNRKIDEQRAKIKRQLIDLGETL